MTHHSSEGPPCRSMEDLLQKVADGSASGIGRWYALAHAARCTRCGTFLDRMKVTLQALKDTKEKTDDSEAVARLKERLALLEDSSSG